ncbi:hypothetical protein J6P92_04630 [bacterium]|nr:hypothetical protein [bacterium]
MNAKVKEILGIFVCIGLLIGLGIYTGFFNNFGMADVQRVLNSAFHDISNPNFDFIKTGNDDSVSFGNKNVSTIGQYRANNIPEQALKGARMSGFWPNIFKSEKKVVFYVYEPSGKSTKYSMEFHEKIKEKFKNGKLNKYYNFEPSEFAIYRNYNVGLIGSTKVCNSIEECKNMHELTSSRAAMQIFLDKCAANFCIINLKNNEFVMIRNKDANEAIKALNVLSGW